MTRNDEKINNKECTGVGFGSVENPRLVIWRAGKCRGSPNPDYAACFISSSDIFAF